MKPMLAERLADIPRGFVVEARGLTVLRRLENRREWEALGRELAGRSGSYQWALGDWILLHRGEWGERYAMAMRVTGLALQTCRDLAHTCEMFPPRERTTALAYSFYRYAAAAGTLVVARRLLIRAADEGWTCARLCEEVRHANDARAGQTQQIRAARSRGRNRNYVRCPQCQHEFAIRGHRVERLGK